MDSKNNQTEKDQRMLKRIGNKRFVSCVCVILCSLGSFGLEDQLTTACVGYVDQSNDDEMTGRFSCNFKSLGEPFVDGAALGRTVSTDCEGVKLHFYDGSRWRDVESAMTEDGEMAWFDIEDGYCADDIVVPQGSAIDYEKPASCPKARITMAGLINSEIIGNHFANRSITATRINDIKIPIREVEKIVTRVVTITNEVGVEVKDEVKKTLFLIARFDGTVINAKYDTSLVINSEGIESFEFLDPKTDARMSMPMSEIKNFLVDQNAPEKERMDSQQVADLFELVRRCYISEQNRKRLEEEERRRNEREREFRVKINVISAKLRDWPTIFLAICATVGGTFFHEVTKRSLAAFLKTRAWGMVKYVICFRWVIDGFKKLPIAVSWLKMIVILMVRKLGVAGAKITEMIRLFRGKRAKSN